MQDLTTPEGRRRAVQEWQRYYGMEPRNDSKLTDMFAEGHLPWSPDAVARELFSTNFIYQETVYGEVIEDFMRAVASRIRRENGTSWKHTWDITRFYAPIALKLLCMERARLLRYRVRVTLSRAAPRLLPGWIQT